MSFGNVHLTPQLVQAVRDAADIVAVASEHTRLRKAGRQYQGLCPIHKEKTPSFSVDPAKGVFYCFGCGAGGDAIKLHMLTSGDDFPAAIESLALHYGIPLPSRSEARFAGGRAEQDVEGALRAAAELFTDQLRKSSFAREYLEKRRIPQELIERFGLGYAPEGYKNLLQALHGRVPQTDLEAAGLVARSERGGDLYDRFRHRLMFPIHGPSGRLVGFGGRTLGDDKAKYVNTNETERFHKGHLLYGLHLAKREIRDSGRAVLCEGYFDVMGTVASGVEGAVAGMGTALTAEQAKLLARYAEEVVVAYDGDSAGENAFQRALPLLLAEQLRARRARFPGTHDPDSLRLAEGEECVRQAIETAEDAVGAELRRLLPTSRAAGIREVSQEQAAAIKRLIEEIKNPLDRDLYIHKAAEFLGVSKGILGSQLKERANWGGGIAQPVGAVRVSVRSLEEQALEQLLRHDETAQVPALEALPPPEVFFDTGCRNIYQAFCALYAGDGAPPDFQAVKSKLGDDEGTVARLAKIVLEREFPSERVGPRDSLGKLVDRWRGQRLKELLGEINEAQRKGDQALLNRLVEEKTRLSRANQGLA